LGALLAMTGLAALIWALTAAPDLGWTDPWIVAGWVGGAALLAAFLWAEAREKHPMMPLGLFRSSVFSGINLLTLLLYFALGGAMFFLPFQLIRVHGWSATLAGAAMLPFAVIMSLFSGAAGRLADRFGARLSLGLGPVLAGVGLLLLAVMPDDAGYVGGPLAGMTVLAIGMTLAVGPLTAAVMGAVPEGHTGVASGVNNAVARVAGLLAVAVLGVILSALFAHQVSDPARARDLLGAFMGGETTDDALRDAFHRGYVGVMLTCAVAAFTAGVIGALTAPKRKAS
ncbi:MAG: MFS transporter, partial [Brevundimonas sp.]